MSDQAAYVRAVQRMQVQDRALLSLRIKSLWITLKRQPLVVWLLCFYVSVEYLRIHQAYPVLDVLPWGSVSALACLIALLAQGQSSRRFNALDGLVICFFLWLILASMVGWRQAAFWADWASWASWPVLYLLVSTVPVRKNRFLLFWLAFLVINLKMSQHGALSWASRGFTFSEWGVTGSPGWFQNSGEFAMEMAFIFGASWWFLWALRPFLSKRKFWLLAAVFPGTAVASVLASSSRGGQLAAAAVTLVILVQSGVRLRRIFAGVLVLVLGWLVMPDAQKERFTSMGSDETSVQRLEHWREAVAIVGDNPVAGVGYGNWVPYYTFRNGVRPEIEIHNTTLQAAVDLGLIGAGLFYSMIAVSFLFNARTRRRARKLGDWGRALGGVANGLDAGMVGLIIAAQFMSVLFYPMFWMSFALTTALAEAVNRAAKAQRPPPPTTAARIPLQVGA